MKKGTSVVLLSIISVLMAIVMVFAFIRFPVGTERYNSFLGAIELDYGMSDSAVYTLELDKTSDIPTDKYLHVNECGYTEAFKNDILCQRPSRNDFEIFYFVRLC